MCKGERPIGTAKGKQPNTEALCHPPPPPPKFSHTPHAPVGPIARYVAERGPPQQAHPRQSTPTWDTISSHAPARNVPPV